ncbi:MAG: hypothetical protein ACFB50_11560 [Rubrobacteraceae bacterium]
MIRGRDVEQAEVSRESRAYRSGWEDGRFGGPGAFSSNADLSSFTDLERLAYYRGHREGRRVRKMLRGNKVFA